MHNKFWKNIYFTVCYTLLPLNALLIQMLLFDTSLMGVKLLYLLFLFGTMSFLFALNLITSDINIHISKGCDIFYNFYISENTRVNVGNKFKVMSLYIIVDVLNIL